MSVSRDQLIRIVENKLSLVVTKPEGEGRRPRRTCTSEEIATEVWTMPVKDVNKVGRLKKRIYFDVGDRQYRATYEGDGQWRIAHRARYW